MRKHVKVIMIIVILMFVGSCFAGYGFYSKNSGDAKASGRDYAIAKVNGTKIMRSQIEKDALKIAEEYGMKEVTSEDIKSIRKLALERTILEAEIEKEIKTRKIKASEADVDAAYKKLMDSFPTREEFSAQMERMGLKEEQIKDDMRHNLLRENLFKSIMSDVDASVKEAKMFYEKNKNELYTRPAGTLATIAVFKDKQTATTVKKALDNGADWNKVMEENTDNLVTYTKFEAPEVISTEMLKQTPSFANVKKLELNKVSSVLELPEAKAFYIAVNKGTAEKKVLTYDEVADNAKDAVRQMRVRSYQETYIHNLLKRSDVEILDKEIFPVEEPEKELSNQEITTEDNIKK
ncbi:MAG: SurA N-terminal domain-containing protein [Synergistaceae bacterium]